MTNRRNLNPKKLSKTALVAKVIAFILVSLCMLSVFRWNGDSWWFGELLSLFGLQLSILLMVGSLLNLLQRQRTLSILLIALALFFAWPLTKSYFPANNEIKDINEQSDIRLLSMELGDTAVPDEQRLEFIYTEDATIIFLQNVQQKDASWLSELKLDYPYNQSILSGSTYGLSILSKIPLESVQEVSFGVPDQPSLVARFTAEGHSFELIATHLLAPISSESQAKRLAQMDAILSWISELEKSRHPIVMGPMYAGFHTSVYKNLTKPTFNEAGEAKFTLSDASLGFGWKPTWPTSTSLTKTIADHIFYDAKSLKCIRFNVGLPSISGGEHRPIIASFKFE